VTRQALSALLNGRAGVSAAMALRLEAALGTSAEMWIEMQAGYDQWKARPRPKPKVTRWVATHSVTELKGLFGRRKR
jgi:plasmid maintenance system antidote protein VapI